MAAELFGTWKLSKSENFDAYMKAVGVNFALRKIGNAARSTVTIEGCEKDSVKITTSSTFSTHRLECSIGQEADQQTVDGRICRTVMNWKNNVLVQEETWSGKSTSISRYLDDSGRLVAELRMGDILAKRIYEKADV